MKEGENRLFFMGWGIAAVCAGFATAQTDMSTPVDSKFWRSLNDPNH